MLVTPEEYGQGTARRLVDILSEDTSKWSHSTHISTPR